MHEENLLSLLIRTNPSIEVEEGEQVEILNMIQEALDLVEGHTRVDFRSREEIPPPVARVVTRMVVRSLEQSHHELGIPPNASNLSQTAGSFSRNVGFESGSTSGGVWLNRQDRIRLRRWSTGGGASTVRMW